MKLTNSNSYNVAKAVLSCLATIGNDDEYEGYVKLYSNGREQGFYVVNFQTSKAVSFAQFRHSDNIVIYVGKPYDFGSGNMPSDEVYENKKMFSYNEIYQAAEFIFDYLFKEE